MTDQNSKPDTTTHVWTAEIRRPIRGFGVSAAEVRTCGHHHQTQAAAQRCAERMKRLATTQETPPA